MNGWMVKALRYYIERIEDEQDGFLFGLENEIKKVSLTPMHESKLQICMLIAYQQLDSNISK